MDDITKCYEILGLKPGASFEAVKETYRDLVKVWHPDRFAHDPKLQVKAQEKLKEINEAFQKIQEFLNHLHTYQQATGDRQEYSKEEQYSKAEESTQEDTKQSTESKEREYHDSSQEPPKESSKTPGEERSAYQKDYQEPRPWVRFWARTLDLILLSFPAGFLFGLLFPEFTTRVTKAGGPLVIGFFILPFIVIMEVIIITIFGNTPAKAILKTKITNSEGKSLSFAEALKRSFYIYFAGYAIGIPLIPLATYYWQYRKLKKDGKTSWDNRFDFNIAHEHIGGLRIASYVVLFLFCSFVMGIANKESYPTFYKTLQQTSSFETTSTDDLIKQHQESRRSSTETTSTDDLIKQHQESRRSSTFPESWISKGQALIDKKDYHGAVQAFGNAIIQNPGDAFAYCNRGWAYSFLHDYKSAIQDFDKAIQLNPQYAMAYYNRGLSYHNISGNDQQAINDYTKAIQLNPQYAKAYYMRGHSYYALGNNQQAINDCNKAIQLNPQYAKAYYMRGLVYRDLNNRQQAIEDLKIAVELGDKDAQKVLNSIVRP